MPPKMTTMVPIDQLASLVVVQIVSQRALRGERHALHVRIEHHIGRIDQPDQQARQDARGEQRDRRLLRRHRIEDHRDRRAGSPRRSRPTTRSGRPRKPLVVAVVLAATDTSCGRPRRRCRPRCAPSRRTARRRRPSSRASEPRTPPISDDHPHHHAARDAALRHDLAGEHEERHRQQRESCRVR